MKLLLTSFLAGILAAAGALALETAGVVFFYPKADPRILTQSFSFLILSSAIEEILKISVFFKATEKRSRLLEMVFSGIFLATGFSAVEIGLKMAPSDSQSFFSGEILFPFLVHLATGFVYAFFTAFSKEKIFWKRVSKPLALGISIHFCYNLIASGILF